MADGSGRGKTGREEPPDERAVAAAEREIYRHVQQLHDQGVIDLDAPARAVVDAVMEHFPAAEEGRTATAAQAGGYWVVGDQGWCNHLT